MPNHFAKFPPNGVPDGWFQLMPFAIAKRGCPQVRIVPFVKDIDVPWAYGVQYAGQFHTAYIGPDGRFVRPPAMCVVLDPPTYPTFKEALAVAERFLNGPWQ